MSVGIILGFAGAIIVGLMTTGIEDKVIGGFDKFFQEWDCHTKMPPAWASICKNTLNYYRSSMTMLAVIPVITSIMTFAGIAQKINSL